MHCYKLDSPVSKLQSKRDLLHPHTYLDWWEKYVCNDFSFKQIACPISNWDVSIGDIYFLRKWYWTKLQEDFEGVANLFFSVLLQSCCTGPGICRYIFVFVCFSLCLCAFVSFPLHVCVFVFVSMSLSLSLCVWSSFELGERIVERREAPPPAALICPATVPAVFVFVYLSLPLSLSFSGVFVLKLRVERSLLSPPPPAALICPAAVPADLVLARAAAPLTGFHGGFR